MFVTRDTYATVTSLLFSSSSSKVPFLFWGCTSWQAMQKQTKVSLAFQYNHILKMQYLKKMTWNVFRDNVYFSNICKRFWG